MQPSINMKSPYVEKDNGEWYRVSVCMERFFSDERARCYVSVCGARRVRWLRRKLRRLFALPARARRLALLTRGHLLPPDEPLAPLLRPDDVVHVIPTTIDMEIADNSEPAIKLLETSTSILPSEQSIRKRKRDDSTGIPQIDYELDATLDPANCKEFTENIEITNELGTNDPSDSEMLKDMKERALALLDTCAPATRRRRVRRRRPRRLPSVVTDSPESHNALETIQPPVVQLHQENQHGPVNVAENGISFSDKDVALQSDKDALPMYTAQSPPHCTRTAAVATSPTTAPETPIWLSRDVPATPSVVQNKAATPRVARIVRPLEALMVTIV